MKEIAVRGLLLHISAFTPLLYKERLPVSSVEESLSLRILGNTTIECGNRGVAPDPPKFRQILALLAFRVGAVVSVQTIIDELWPTCPPRTAVTTTQTYIYGLRKIVDALAEKPMGKHVIATRSPGYMLTIDRLSVDVHQFRDVVDSARRRSRHDAHGALREYERALDVASTFPLSDLPLGPILAGYADELREEILSAKQERIEIAMRIGDPASLLAELRLLTTTYPLREHFAGYLMQALAKTNRRAEALEVFNDVRARLIRELGIEPCSDLQTLQENVLRGTPCAPRTLTTR